MVPSIQIGEPKGFGWREVLILNAIGLIPASILGPIVGAAISSPVVAYLLWKIVPVSPEIPAQMLLHLFLAVGAFAAVALGLGLFFWPAIVGNLYVRRLARRCLDRKPPDQPSYVCQVSFFPRLHGGFRGFMEDADDVGHLWITDEVLSFAGDHVSIALPLDSIQGVSIRNVGWRGLWVAGKRIRITANAVDGVTNLEFVERQSATAVSSQRISAAIIRELSGKLQRVARVPLANADAPRAAS